MRTSHQTTIHLSAERRVTSIPLIHGFSTSAFVRPFGLAGRRSHSRARSPGTLNGPLFSSPLNEALAFTARHRASVRSIPTPPRRALRSAWISSTAAPSSRGACMAGSSMRKNRPATRGRLRDRREGLRRHLLPGARWRGAACWTECQHARRYLSRGKTVAYSPARIWTAGSDSADGREADQVIVERVNGEPFALDPIRAAYGHGARAGGDPELTLTPCSAILTSW